MSDSTNGNGRGNGRNTLWQRLRKSLKGRNADPSLREAIEEIIEEIGDAEDDDPTSQPMTDDEREMVRDAVSGILDDLDATRRYFDILQTGFGAALGRAAAAAEIDDASIEPRTQFLTAAFIGINLTHRNMDDVEVAHALMDGVRAEVESWGADARR